MLGTGTPFSSALWRDYWKERMGLTDFDLDEEVRENTFNEWRVLRRKLQEEQWEAAQRRSDRQAGGCCERKLSLGERIT